MRALTMPMAATSAAVSRGERFRLAVPVGHVFNRTRAGDELGGDNRQSEEEKRCVRLHVPWRSLCCLRDRQP